MILYVSCLLYYVYTMKKYIYMNILAEWSNDTLIGHMKTFCLFWLIHGGSWIPWSNIYQEDILLKLCEYGEINQSKLMSYCGLNNVKHKEILDDLVWKELIKRMEEN